MHPASGEDPPRARRGARRCGAIVKADDREARREGGFFVLPLAACADEPNTRLGERIRLSDRQDTLLPAKVFLESYRHRSTSSAGVSTRRRWLAAASRKCRSLPVTSASAWPATATSKKGRSPGSDSSTPRGSTRTGSPSASRYWSSAETSSGVKPK